MTSKLFSRYSDFAALMRLDRPIGTLLLLWPTWWALWLAGNGTPSLANIVIFSLGVWLMRSAGCVINDYADRHFDGHVARTRQRPMARGAVSEKEALALFVLLCTLAFALVLLTNTRTVLLSFAGAVLAACYPFMKRYTHLPQVVLGAAFSWSIVMAFSAQSTQLPPAMWLVFAANVTWTVAYDTLYAMVDRDDDLRIGIKSSAILFGRYDVTAVVVLQAVFTLLLVAVGYTFNLGWVYYVSLALATALQWRQYRHYRSRDRDACFAMFLNNNYVGMVVFMGIALDFMYRAH